jgi:small GTP-binding protein
LYTVALFPQKDRLMLDAFREKQDSASALLLSLADIGTTVGAKTLTARIERDLIKKLREDRFHLVVVGEFNHGKSTFVNALLGRDALPVGVTPTTAAIHHIRYADAPEATIVAQDGTRKSIAFDALRGFAVGGKDLGDSEAASVDYIEVGYPSPLLRERILLVDTPGVNDLSHQRADITYSYIPRADAVLFLLDAGQILKESERVFLEEKLLKASRDKIIFVITKWDQLSANERTEALQYAKHQLGNLVSDPVVFPISAESALQGQTEASGMPELLAHLTRFLAEERGRILLDNAFSEGLLVSALLEKGISARKRALTMKAEELTRRIEMLEADLAGRASTIEQRRASIREEIVRIKTGAKKDLERFVDEVNGKLPGVIDSAKKEDLSKYLAAFLEETFRTWAQARAKEIAEDLEALAERTIALVKDDAHDSTKRITAALGEDTSRLDVQVDTFKYDVGVGALFAAGLAGLFFVNLTVGGLLLAAAPVLALLLKDRVDAQYKNRAKELAPEILRKTADQVGPKIDELVDEFAAKLDAWVVSAGEELHREILEVLEAARAARGGGDEGDASERASLEALDKQLKEREQAILQAKSELAGKPQTAPTEAAPVATPQGGTGDLAAAI